MAPRRAAPGRPSLEEFLERFAAELGSRLDASGRSIAIPQGSKARLLELARDVAHGTERKNAPLAAFIAGGYVFARSGDGVDGTAAVDEAVQVARSLLSSEDERG